MTIIVFLIDTSASMMQKTHVGTTYLDFARLAVEYFLKQRQRDPGYKGDRYMLMTFDEYPMNVKTGWKESQATFTEQLKNLRAGGLCSFSSGVESVLRFVNLNRMQSGIENYGYGRYPCYSEHVVIISVTDGESSEASCSTSSDGPGFSKQTTIGSELTVEPFRWDQRLFSLVLRFSGQQSSSFASEYLNGLNSANDTSLLTSPSSATASAQTNVLTDNSKIDVLCSAMGGRSFAIKSHRMLYSSIDTIIQRIQQNGVMVTLQKHGPDPLPVPPIEAEANSVTTTVDVAENFGDSWKNQNVMLILKPNKQGQGHWPIPEAYSPESVTTNLPPRLARPKILFCCETSQPMINQEFPFDKYELANTPLSQYILSRKDPVTCWQVFVENSSRTGGIGLPFGYLKTSSNIQSVILFLMPYNYPALLPLIDEAKNANAPTTPAFRQKMDKYLTTVPPYYYSPLRKAFKRINLSVPFLEEFNQQIYSYNIVSLMTKIKHLGKDEFEIACTTVAKNLESFSPALLNGPQLMKANHCRTTNPEKNSLLESDLRRSLQPYLISIPQLFKDVKICVSDGIGSFSPLLVPSAQFKNPFEIERRSLISQLDKMRLNFDQQVETNALHVLEGGMPGQKIKLQHAEDLHSQPISKMGDYQEYMRCLSSIGAAPLRELEPQAARPHAFGNPFKLDKKNIAVDEVGEVNTSSSSAINTNNANSDRSERRNKNQPSSLPGAFSIGMSGSFSSVPVAIRSKRKPGAIDSNLLISWKRRRKSSSNGSDYSENSSFASDVSNVTELEEMLQDERENEKCDEDRDYRQVAYNNFESEDNETPLLMIYDENGASSSSPTPEKTFSTNLMSNSNGFSSINNTGDEPSYVNATLHENHASRKKLLSFAYNRHSNGTNAIAPLLTASELSSKQMELSKAVRGVGDRHMVFSHCMNTLKDVVNYHERDFLVRFAFNEARRFKRNDLMKQLEGELKLVASLI